MPPQWQVDRADTPSDGNNHAGSIGYTHGLLVNPQLDDGISKLRGSRGFIGHISFLKLVKAGSVDMGA